MLDAQPVTVREKLFNVRLHPQEHARFVALAEHYGCSVATLLRMLVKRDADALGIKVPEAKVPKKGARK